MSYPWQGTGRNSELVISNQVLMRPGSEKFWRSFLCKDDSLLIVLSYTNIQTHKADRIMAVEAVSLSRVMMKGEV
jgi:hypothetical protein